VGQRCGVGVAVFCTVLQCVAVCCSVLQCVAVCCSGYQKMCEENKCGEFKQIETNVRIELKQMWKIELKQMWEFVCGAHQSEMTKM